MKARSGQVVAIGVARIGTGLFGFELGIWYRSVKICGEIVKKGGILETEKLIGKGACVWITET